MSRDVNYILSYETQPYVAPTPMELDKQAILKDKPNTEFTELQYGYLVYAQLPKYGLRHETIESLKADAVFEIVDGDPVKQVKE